MSFIKDALRTESPISDDLKERGIENLRLLHGLNASFIKDIYSFLKLFAIFFVI
jgi:hypothetical protein